MCLVPGDTGDYLAVAELVGGFYMHDQHTICVPGASPTGRGDGHYDADTMEPLTWKQVIWRISDGSEYWFNHDQYQRYLRR